MWRLLSDPPGSGPENMARDEAILAAGATPTLRLYAWRPATISLGYFQDHAAVRAALPPAHAELPMVRRITGGGAIWHEHEVTYALVGELGTAGLPERTRDCYSWWHEAVAAALAAAGHPSATQVVTVGDRRYRSEPRCFASPAAADLVAAGGGKILGSAARTRSQRLLMHGSLKLASNPWDGAAVAGCGLDAESAAACLVAALAARSGAHPQPGDWTSTELGAADQIRKARYATPDWVVDRRGPRP